MSLVDKALDQAPKVLKMLYPYARQKMEDQFEAHKYDALDRLGDKLPSNITPVETPPETPESEPSNGDVATACIPCSLNHFAVSSGLLNEAVRFEGDGIAGKEVVNRISAVFEELGAMERVDLTEAKIQSSPAWEQDLAREARDKSRAIRHKLESLSSIQDLRSVAADIQNYYRGLAQEWYRRRQENTSQETPSAPQGTNEKAEAFREKVKNLSPKDRERLKERVNGIIDSGEEGG